MNSFSCELINFKFNIVGRYRYVNTYEVLLRRIVVLRYKNFLQKRIMYNV